MNFSLEMDEDVYGFAKPGCERKSPNSAIIYALLTSAFVEGRSFLVPLYAAALQRHYHLQKKAVCAIMKHKIRAGMVRSATAEQEEVYP